MGAAVTLFARNADVLETVRSGLAAHAGQEHRVSVVDFAAPDSVAEAVERETAMNPVHILINNTGGPAPGPASEAEPQAFEDAFRMHLVCGQVLVRAVAPGMAAAGYGRIVNIISTSVVTPIAGLGVSNTVRGAVANWGRTIAAELAPHGITVNNVLPGFTDTGRLRSLIKGRAERGGISEDEVIAKMHGTIPAARFADPSELASVVGFLASPGAAYVNGVNLPVDGGRLASQ